MTAGRRIEWTSCIHKDEDSSLHWYLCKFGEPIWLVDSEEVSQPMVVEVFLGPL